MHSAPCMPLGYAVKPPQAGSRGARCLLSGRSGISYSLRQVLRGIATKMQLPNRLQAYIPSQKLRPTCSRNRMRLEKPKPVFSALWASMRPMSTCWSKDYSPSPTAQRCKKSSPRRTAPSMSLRDCWTHQAELPRAYAPPGFSKQERKPHAL
jgi:hypothetical protein